MPTRFSIRYDTVGLLMGPLGLGPRLSRVEVGPTTLRVSMGWAFRAEVPLGSMARAHRDRDTWRWGIGVHGWRGTWMVNGSVHGIVTIDVHPRVRVRVVGLPLSLTKLHLSLEDPDGFLAALAAAGVPQG